MKKRGFSLFGRDKQGEDVLCENCRSIMKKKYRHMSKREHADFFKCPKCKLLWAPTLNFDTSFQSSLNERKRQDALQDVREQEFDDVLALLKKHVPQGRGLDVGCSYGWFIEKAEKLYEMEGIEAEEQVAQKARDKGMHVCTGMFPQDLNLKNGKYDFIIFNNVWEHINYTTDLIDNTLEYLKEHGMLVITVPLSSGGMYLVSECFEKLGRVKELVRLWQLHFHSPHFYFYTKKNLEQMMVKRGCELIECRDIRSINVDKMKDRFEMDTEEKYAALKALLFKGIYPVLKRMPADKAVFFFRYDSKVREIEETI